MSFLCAFDDLWRFVFGRFDDARSRRIGVVIFRLLTTVSSHIFPSSGDCDRRPVVELTPSSWFRAVLDDDDVVEWPKNCYVSQLIPSKLISSSLSSIPSI